MSNYYEEKYTTMKAHDQLALFISELKKKEKVSQKIFT